MLVHARMKNDISQSCTSWSIGQLVNWSVAMFRSLNQIPSLEEGKVAAVMGIGGGADAITAYTVAVHCQEKFKLKVPYVLNVKKAHPQDALSVDRNVYDLGRDVVPLVEGDRFWGNCKIDQSLPPLNSTAKRLVLAFDQFNEQDMASIPQQFRKLVEGIDIIIAVDGGGDSITGGIDHKGDPEMGKDRVMLRLLRGAGVPVLFTVAGPGCDGESTTPMLVEAALNWKDSFLGVYQLDDTFMSDLKKYAHNVGDLRTPSLMYNITNNLFPSADSKPKSNDATTWYLNQNTKLALSDAAERLAHTAETALRSRCWEETDWVVMPRGIQPLIPREWLRQLWVFQLQPNQQVPALPTQRANL